MRSSSIVAERVMRRMAFTAVLALLVQSSFGVAVNLFCTIPANHSGANPSNYFSGSFRSVLWSLSHGSVSLIAHAAFGLFLIVMAITMVPRALSLHRRAITAWTIVGLLMIVGAGFNGASFLDYNKNASSFIMTLLAFGAIASYSIVGFVLSSHDR